MKTKLFFLSLTVLFALSSCADKISVEIISPKDAQEDTTVYFRYNQDIDVKIRASAERGRVQQVVLNVDTLIYETLNPPYNYIIPAGTFRKNGFYTISATAYSYNGVMEGDAIYVKIVGY